MNELSHPKTLSNHEASYLLLKKAGILVEHPDSTFGFSSLLAKRYYFDWIFPNRSESQPVSLLELIKKVIGNMSALTLKNSTILGDFPKAAVFQHLFMEGLVFYTWCPICSELSKIFPSTSNTSTQQTIHGEIDFYLSGSLRWGIELLINGDGIGEHIGRFSPPNGKYVSLDVRDYMVVDFRGTITGRPTNISASSLNIWYKFTESCSQSIKNIGGSLISVFFLLISPLPHPTYPENSKWIYEENLITKG
jgi:hypothetical protein